jgi:toxin ParE1/3/4
MRIRWTDPAVNDFTKICDYIEAHGATYRARHSRRLNLLEKFPEHGRTGRKPDTRELAFTGLPYLAIYRIHGDAIEILRILHGAQIWP